MAISRARRLSSRQCRARPATAALIDHIDHIVRSWESSRSAARSPRRAPDRSEHLLRRRRRGRSATSNSSHSSSRSWTPTWASTGCARSGGSCANEGHEVPRCGGAAHARARAVRRRARQGQAHHDPGKTDVRPEDLVQRVFWAPAPHRLCVAGLTYVANLVRLGLRRLRHGRLQPPDRWLALLDLAAHRPGRRRPRAGLWQRERDEHHVRGSFITPTAGRKISRCGAPTASKPPGPSAASGARANVRQRPRRVADRVLQDRANPTPRPLARSRRRRARDAGVSRLVQPPPPPRALRRRPAGRVRRRSLPFDRRPQPRGPGRTEPPLTPGGSTSRDGFSAICPQSRQGSGRPWNIAEAPGLRAPAPPPDSILRQQGDRHAEEGAQGGPEPRGSSCSGAAGH
jgi:hypothetical protein